MRVPSGARFLALACRKISFSKSARRRTFSCHPVSIIGMIEQRMHVQYWVRLRVQSRLNGAQPSSGFFCLHEQIFWAICGVADFVTRDATDVWELKTASHNAAFTRWFSGFLDNEAESALRLNCLSTLGCTPSKKHRAEAFPSASLARCLSTPQRRS